MFEGKSVEVIKAITQSLIQLNQQPKLYFSRDVQVEYGINRDRSIVDFYHHNNLEIHVGLNHFLQQQEDYSSLWKDYHDYQQKPVYKAPKQINTPKLKLDLPQLSIDELKQKYSQLISTQSYLYQGGEDNAQGTINSFVAHRYQGYHWKMSRPWLAQQGATSHLSAHLDFGTISSRTVYQRIIEVELKTDHAKNKFSLQSFRDRLRWHDKFSQRHYFHPELAWKNRYPEFDQWYSPEALAGEKQELFQAWCDGKTGLPMVDASMRQLNKIGWMNFRMRAMCVTFLCINCGVSWHHGAQYFMSKLVDGNIAINHWQWQAQAGVTNPASKTFRIYNPTKNLQEKDPYLQFVRYWIPELKPYRMQELLSGEYSATSNYPQPILDYKLTRKINGKTISDLRKKVKARLEQEGGEEYQQAIGASATIEKYLAIKDEQYRAMGSANSHKTD